MSTPSIQQLCTFLDNFSPPKLAEDWDNVGLLVGDREDDVAKVMTCLTITPDSADEAIERDANLIVVHHPLPFKPLSRITTDTVPGTLLWKLIRAGVAIYSSHTSFDSTAMGINQSIAEGLQLTNIQPLEPSLEIPELGSGRYGNVDTTTSLSELASRLKSFLNVERLKVVGDQNAGVSRVAIACGAAGSFIGKARAKGCDAFVLGETNFHTCLEAEATGISLLLPGHYPSERFAVERLATTIANEFAAITVWASEREHDPIVWL